MRTNAKSSSTSTSSSTTTTTPGGGGGGEGKARPLALLLCLLWPTVVVSALSSSSSSSSSPPSPRLRLAATRTTATAHASFRPRDGVVAVVGRHPPHHRHHRNRATTTTTTTTSTTGLHLSVPRGGGATEAVAAIAASASTRLSSIASTPAGAFNVALAILGMSTAALKLYGGVEKRRSGGSSGSDKAERQIVTGTLLGGFLAAADGRLVAGEWRKER